MIIGALAWLLAGGIGSNLVYYVTPTELLARGPEVKGATLRLGGTVEEGSVEWNAESLALRFRLRDPGAVVSVVSEGAPPQMFQDGVDALVEGVYEGDAVFRATTVMVKHSNEYAPPEEGDEAHQRYRELTEERDES